MSRPALFGISGENTRAALAYLQVQDDGAWVTLLELAGALGAKATHITTRLKCCRRTGLVAVRQIHGGGKRGWLEWQITPAGRMALAAALAAEAAVQSGAVRRRPNRYRPAPKVQTVRDQLLAVLSAAPAGVWMLSSELKAQAGITARLSMGGVFRHALAAKVVEMSYTATRLALWRVVRPEVSAAEACAADASCDAAVLESADDMAERARQAARWANWQPLAGSVAARALAWLGTQPAGAMAEPAWLAAHIDSDADTVITALSVPVCAGLVEVGRSRRDVRVPVYGLPPGPARTGVAAVCGVQRRDCGATAARLRCGGARGAGRGACCRCCCRCSRVRSMSGGACGVCRLPASERCEQCVGELACAGACGGCDNRLSPPTAVRSGPAVVHGPASGVPGRRLFFARGRLANSADDAEGSEL